MKVLSFLTFSLFLLSCNKYNLPANTPNCIKTKIRQMDKSNTDNSAVWSYEYNGQLVYFITYGCCDQYSDLYDNNCTLICHPDGGLTGGGDGKCVDFFTKRKNEKLIWKNE